MKANQENASYNILRKLGISSIVLLLGFGFLASAAADTGINSCQLLDSEGVYNLTGNITHSNTNTCLNVTRSNVTIDGQGYFIKGQGTGGKDGLINIHNGSIGVVLDNVTVKNITLYNTDSVALSDGILAEGAENLTIRDVNSSGHQIGISFGDSLVEHSDLINISTSGNSYGGIEINAGDNNTISNSTLNDSVGLAVRSYGNQEVIDSEIQSSSLGVVSTGFGNVSLDSVNITTSNGPEVQATYSKVNFDEPGIWAENVLLDGMNTSFELGAVSLNASESGLSTSSDLRGIGKFFEARNESSSGSYIQMNVSYTSSEVNINNLDKEGLRIYNKTGSSFSKVNTDFIGVDTATQQVYSNITQDYLNNNYSDLGVLDYKYNISGCQLVDYSGVLEVTSDISAASGEYPCINVTADNVEIRGNNHQITGDDSGTNTEDAAIYSGSSISNLTVKNLRLKDWNYGHNLFNNGIKSVLFRNVTAFSNVDGGKITRVDEDVNFTEVNYSSNSDHGLDLREPNVTIEDSKFNYNNQKGINIYPASDVENYTIRDSEFIANSWNGIDVYSLDEDHNIEIDLINNTIFRNQYEGVNLEEANNSVIRGNNVSSNNLIGTKGGGIYINNSEHIDVEDNVVGNNSKYGIKMTYVNHSTVESTEVFDVTGATGDAVRLGHESEEDLSQGNVLKNITAYDNVISVIRIDGEKNTVWNSNISFNPGERAIKVRGDEINISENYIEEASKGIDLLSNDSVVEGNKVTSTDEAFQLNSEASHNVLRSNKFLDSTRGLDSFSFGLNRNNTIEDTLFENMSEEAIFLKNKASFEDNKFENVSVKDSYSWIVTRSVNTTNKFNDIELVDGFNATIRGKNFNITDTSKGQTPSLPQVQYSVGEFFNITNESYSPQTAWVQLNISYPESAVQGINESDLSIQHYDGSSWTEVQDAGIDTNKNLVYGNATSFSQFTIAGEGEPDISLSPSDHDFGEVDTDSTDTKTFTVTNDGRTNLTLTDTSITGDDGQFSITSGDVSSDTNVTTSGSYDIEVEFAPGSADTFDADLEIDSNDPQGTEVIALDGEGTSPDSGGGGGGGGGASIGDTTTDTVSKSVGSLDAGESSSLDVDESERLGPKKVEVTAANSVSNFDIEVNIQQGEPNGISTPAGNIYRYMDVSVSVDEEDIDEGVIEFEVNESWIDDNGYDVDSVQLERYHDSEWNALETSLLDETGSKYEFEAITPGFSFFAVSAEEETQQDGGDGEDTGTGSGDGDQTGDQNATEEDPGDVNQTDEQPEDQKSEGTGLPLVPIAVVLVLSAAGAAAYLKREEIEQMIQEDSGDGGSEDYDLNFGDDDDYDDF